MDFDPGKIDSAIWSGTHVADAGRRSAHQHNLVAESAGRELTKGHVRNRVIRIGTNRALVVDHAAANGIGPEPERRPEFEVHDPGRAISKRGLVVGQAEVEPRRLNIQRSKYIPLVRFGRTAVRKGEQRVADDAVGIRGNVKEARGAAVAA